MTCAPKDTGDAAQVYDPDLFDRHRLYSIAVRKASHPDVLEYVQSLAHSLKVGKFAAAKRSTQSMAAPPPPPPGPGSGPQADPLARRTALKKDL